MRNRLLKAVICAVFIFGACAQSAQVPTELDAAIRGLESADPLARSQAFYALLRQGAGKADEEPFIARIATARLLHAQAGQAERIKSALIEALNRESAYVQDSQKRNIQLPEAYTNYYGDLIGSVASLHDARSLNGLLGAITTGGMATDGLADIGAPAVDGVSSKLQDSDARVRSGAVQALGKFLQRPQQLAQNRNAEAMAQRGLIKALDDASPFVRAAAVDSIGPIRNAPEVKQKLESMAARDTYRTTAAPGAAFPVREASKRTLTATDYWVMRSEGSLVCRVQAGDESPQGVKYLGPYTTRAAARTNMCKHYDETKSDSAKCWDLDPKDVCK